jgi:hypothetical protein
MRNFELNSMGARGVRREKEAGGIMMRLLLLHVITTVSDLFTDAHWWGKRVGSLCNGLAV